MNGTVDTDSPFWINVWSTVERSMPHALYASKFQHAPAHAVDQMCN